MKFIFQAVAALSAGWAINIITWQQMLLGCLIPILMMLLILTWEGFKLYRTSALISRG